MKLRRLSAARLSFSLATAIAALLAIPTVQAANWFWDGGTVDIATAGNGASGGTAGNWNTTTLNWDQGNTLAHVAWNSTHTANFGGTAGAVAVGAGITANGLTFSTTGYSFTGSAISLAAGSTITSLAGTQTFTGGLATADNIFRFTNSNTTSTFANATLLTVGGNIGGASNSLQINGSGTRAPVGFSGTLTWGGTTTVSANNAVHFLTATVTGLATGGINMAASSSIMRQTAIDNTFLGKIAATSNAFTIVQTNAGNSNALNLTNFPNASLAFWDNAGTVSFAFTGAITAGANGYLFGSTRAGNTINITTTANVLSGTAGLQLITGSLGSLNITNANNFTGTTINSSVSAKTITIGNNLAIQNSAIDTAGAGTYVAGVTTPTIGGLIGTKNLRSSVFATAGYDALTSLTLNPGTGVTRTYSGVIANSTAGLALSKSGAGTQVLSGPNTYAGLTTISAGVLRITNNTALGTVAGGVTQSGTSALEIDGTAGAVTVGAEALSINGGGITNFGALRNIAGNNIYGGTVTMAAQSRINSDSGTLTLNNATAAVSSSNLTLVVGGAGNLTISGPVAIGSGAVSKADGASTLTLSGNNTFTGGLAITAGTVQLGNAGALNSSAGSENAVTFAASSTGTLALGGNSVVIRSLTSNATPGTPVVENANAGNAALTIGNSLNLASSFAGVIRDGTGGGTLGLTKVGTNTLTLTGDNSYTGATLVSDGTLTLSGTGDINSSSGITVNGGGAKFLHTGSVAASPAVALTLGTLTGSGTVDSVNVGDATGGIVSNNDGVAGAALTIGTLTFNGAATINTFGNASAPIVTTSLATNAAGSVTINPSAASWAPGTYNLISYGGGSVTGAGSGQFVLGTVTGLGARQSKTLGDSTTAITLTVGADDPIYWAGDGDGKWNLASTSNWKLTSDNSYTTFLASDNVIFNDSATGVGPIAVDIDTATVTPNSTTFNNTTKDFTLGGAFGISTGSLTKSGAGSLTISNANSYTGNTTINGGVLDVSTDGAQLYSGASGIAAVVTVTNGGVLVVRNYGQASPTGLGSTSLGNLNNTGGQVVLDGGTLRFNNETAVRGRKTNIGAGGGTLEVVNNSALTLNSTGSIIFSGANTLTLTGDSTSSGTIEGVIAGTGVSLVKNGDATWTLSGTNTYTGNTTISAGTLSMSANRIASSPNIFIGNGATLAGTGGFTLAANQSVTGTGTTGFVTTSFASGLVTAGNNIISTTGTLNVTRISVLGSGNQITSGNIQSGGSGGSQRGLLVGNGGTGVLTITGGTLTTNGSVAANIDILGNTASSGDGTLNINGGNYVASGVGQLNLGNTNSSGTLTVTSGSATVPTLIYNAGTTGTKTSAIVNLDGGTLTLNNITVTSGLTKQFNFNGGQFVAGANLPAFSGLTLNVKDGGAKIDTNGFSFGISDPLLNFSGATTDSLTKSGLGTLTLSGANTYSGGTSVTGGTLRFSTAAASATNITVAGGAEAGALVAANDAQWVNTGNLTLQNNGVALVDYGSTTPSITVAPISITDFANGTTPGVKLAGASVVSLAVGQIYPLATWTGTGPVDGSAFDLRTHRLAGTFSVSSNTLFLTVTNNAIAPISWNTGNGDWDTSTVNWVDSNLATTAYVDTLDTVLFGDAAGASGNPTVTLATAVTPVSVTMNSTGHDYTVSGAGSIGGSGALTLAPGNTGTFTLATANNTFSGGTTINGGTLALGDATNTLPNTGAVTLDGASAILSLGSNSDTVGAVSLKNEASITGSGTLTGTSYALESGSVSAILGGSGTLTKSTAGTVTLSGANSFTGATTITAGTLRLVDTGALASTAIIALNTSNTRIEFAADSAFITLPQITGGSNLTHTLVSDRATMGAALNHHLGTINFGNSTFNFIEGGNIDSGSAGLTFTSAIMTSGSAGTSILNPTSATLTITGGVTSSINNDARTLQLGGTGTGHSIGGVVTQSVASALSLTKSNTSTWTLSGLSDVAASNYSGSTTIDQGTLAFTTTDPSLTGGLTFGAAVNGANTGTLDLSGVASSATFTGAMLVQTNSTVANTITLGAAKTLTINGGLTMSNSVNNAETRLTMTGGGAFVVNGASMTVGSNSGGSNISGEAHLDMSALGSFTTTLTGNLIIQAAGDNSAGSNPASMTLSNGANSITAASVRVGNSANGSAIRLWLGGSTNVIQTDLMNLGSGARDAGVMDFAGTGGSVTLRNVAGTGRVANVNLGIQSASTTGYTTTNLIDLTGNTADVAIGTFATSLGAKTAANTNDLRFDSGTLDLRSINMAFAKGTGASTNRITIGGGTVWLGGSAAFSDAGTGTLTLATAGSGELIINGGTVTTTVSLLKGTGGTGTATVTLNGGMLNMSGTNIGAATDTVVLAAQSGTLQNVGQINNGAGWTKSTAGTLILAGTNSYTGTATVNAGTLSVTGTLNTSSALAVGGGTLSYENAAPQTVSGFTVNAGSSTITNTNTGATNVLNLGAITRNAGGYVNFANATASNNVIQTSTPNTNGILGSWAFVGSDLAMNDGSGNIVAYTAYADVARRTPGLIADDSTSNVRIVEGSGSLGSITLGATTTTINTLIQSDSGGTSDATVDVGSTETLRTSNIVIQPLAGALTVGTAPNSGTLTTASAGGDLVLTNNSIGNPMTINSAVADNSSASPLIKLGAGTVILNGTNTYTGTTNVTDGTLRLGGAVASATAVVTNGTLQAAGNLPATALVTLSGTSTLDLFGADQSLASLAHVAGNTITNSAPGTGTNTLTINPPTPVTVTIAALVTDGPTAKTALRVGNGNANSQITTNAANTFSGGLILAHPPSGAGTRLLVGSAITGTPWGSGPIVVGETNADKAGILFMTVANTFANPIIVNTALGNDRFGIRNDSVAITLSGLITANVDVVFSSNSATASTTTLTNQVTGSGGLAVDLSQTSTANTQHTVTLSTVPGTNDYAGDTQIGRTNVAPAQNYTANLYLGAADQIPNGTGKGNVIINNNSGTRIGFLSLLGNSETINGLSGNGTLDSSSGTPTFTLGDNNATASFSGVIQDTASTLTLTKIGSGTQTFSGANTFDGPLNVNGGLVAFATSPISGGPLGNSPVVNLNGGGISYTAPGANLLNRPVAIGGSAGTVNVASSTGILSFAITSTAGNLIKTGPGSAVISGSTELNLLANGAGAVVNGGILQAGFGGTDVATLSVGNTGTLDLSDATAEALTLGTSPGALTLNDGAALGFEMDGATNDSITVDVGGTAVTNGTVTLNLFNTGSGLAAGTYTLLSAPSGLAGATYVLGAAPSGFNYAINTSATTVSVTVTAETPIYWLGGQDALWNTLGSSPANWTLDLGGASDASSVPVLADSVIFSATGAPVASDINAAFTVDSLRFLTGHTITASGSGALTLTPATSTNGIRLLNGAGTATISAPLTTGIAQTWNVDPTGSLIVSGNTTFTGSVNKTNTGPLTLSGTNSGAGAITLSAGTLNLNSATALGNGLFNVGAGTTLDSSAAATALTTNNVQNWNGDFTFTGSNDLDLGTGAVTLANSLSVTSSANTLTVGGIIGGSTRSLTKAGAGALTLGGANTYDGGTILTAGALNLTGNNTFGSGGITINGGIATVSGANTYSGGTNLNAGTLNLGNAAALGSSTLTLAGGTLDNSSGTALTLSTNNAQTWNGNFTFAGTNSLNLGTGGVTFTSAPTATVNANTLTIGGNISGAFFGFTKAGAGTLTLAGANTYTGNTTVTGGVLNVTGSHTGATSSLNYGTAAANTVVNVSGNMTLLSTNGANNAGSAAVYNQTAGTVTTTTATQFGSFVANNGGYGYFNLTGGTFQNTQGSINITNNTSTASTGVAYVAANMNLSASNGNMVVAYSASTKGSLTVAPGGTLNYGGSSNSFFLTVSQDAYGVLNVAGGNVDFGTRAIRFGNAGTGQTGIVNLAGGTFTIGQNGSTAATTSANLYVNHAGGTLKAAANLTSPFSPGGVLTTVSTVFGPINNPGTASDFSGGMTVDTNTFNVTEASVLRGATASGIDQSSLSVSGGSGYIGAPMVQFTGGTLAANGTPAAGYAVIDTALGTVTEIVITSPGTYTAAPTVTLTGGGGTGASVTVGALAANTSGGLTKTGLGTLTLTGANTYTGGTNISQGNLVISGTGVLANNAANTVTIENSGTLTMGRNDTWGNSSSGIPVIPIVINAGGTMTTGGSSFTTLGSLTLYGGTLTTAGGANANFPSWALRGTVTVGGSVASTISAGTGTFNSVNLGANSVTGSTFNVADVTGDANTDLTVSALLQNGANASNVAQASSLTKGGAGTMTLTGTNTYTGDTLVVGGTLAFAGGGSANNSAIRIGETFGSDAATLAITDVAGGNAENSTLVVRTGSSGVKTIKATNTSGISTFGGNVYLDADVTTSSDTLGGTLAFSGTDFDLKAQQLTATGSGDTTISNILQNSTGSGKIVKQGTGTLVLSGANTYNGNTEIDSGIIRVDATPGDPDSAYFVGNGGTTGTAGSLLLGGTGGSGGGVTLSNLIAINPGSGNNRTLGGVNTTGTTNTFAGTTYSNGGSLTVTSTNAGAILAFTNIQAIDLKSTNALFDGAGDTTISGAIYNSTGSGSVTKDGTGTLTLTAANTYTGDTVVNTGTLALADNAQLKFVLGGISNTNNSISGAGTVTLEGDFAIDTSAADALPSGTWTLENVTSLGGAYGSNFTVVGFTDAGSNKWTKVNGSKLYTFDETTGILTLASGASYASWINGFFPGETNPAIIGAGADPDNDGINNGVEMVLGGNPATGMDAALLPTIELVVDPVSSPAIPDGSYLLFTYRRSDLSVTAGVTADCETDTDLVAPWTPATGAPGVVIQVDDNFTFTPAAAANTDRVRVYVPQGANTTLFGRLNVIVP